jgi:hypothetical protein
MKLHDEKPVANLKWQVSWRFIVRGTAVFLALHVASQITPQ